MTSDENINTSIIISSLVYLKNNFNLVSRLSTWISLELTISQYNDEKLCKSLDKKDFEVTKEIICMISDFSLLDKYLISFAYDSVKEHIQIIELLLIHGANIHYKKDTLFRFACKEGDLETVKILLKYNPEIQALNNYAIVSACNGNYNNIVELLLENGVDVNFNDCTLLNIACYRGNFKLIKLLIEKYIANINPHENDLLTTACRDNQYEVVKLLIEYKIIIRSEASLIHSIYNENYEMTKLLIGCYPNITDNILSEACVRRDPRIVRLILDRGISPNCRNGEALIMSAMKSRYDFVELLFDYGADAHIRNDYLTTLINNGTITDKDIIVLIKKHL